MTYISQKAKELMLTTGLQAGALTYWAAMVMTSSTVPTENTRDVVAAYTTLDEMDGANYVRKNITASVSVVRDDANTAVYFTCAAQIWTLLGAGTRQIAGVLIIIDPDGTNNPAHNIPAIYDNGGFPKPATGADFPWTPNANGIVRL